MEVDMNKVPDNLRPEMVKYLSDPKRYIKLYPVAYGILKRYLPKE